jgi:cysteine-rich repeat protein
MAKTRIWMMGGCVSLVAAACGGNGGGDSDSASSTGSVVTLTGLPTTSTEPTTSGTGTASTSDGSGSASATSSSTTTDPGTGTTVGPGTCGDGIVDPGEACDDGPNNGPGQPCNADCTTAGTCGDGVLDPGEECDDGPDNGPEKNCSSECVSALCGTQMAEPEIMPKPVDIIIAIDNSGSMGEEIQGVQDNINVNFAQILGQSGLDYRMIMVAKFGDLSGESVCIEEPLSGIPQGGCANPPNAPVNAERFYHYSTEIGSHDSWCKLLRAYDGTLVDDFALAPMGWREWLRPDSYKVFLEVTDDGVTCSGGGWNYADNNQAMAGQTTAAQFDQDLRALDSAAFGETAETRNYKWYSLVAMAYNDPPEKAYTPMDPIITGECPTAADPGTGYQALSIMTDGLRFPLCDPTKYDVVFQAIANEVVADAKIACEFAIPEPPEGKLLDEESIVVVFTPNGQNPVPLMQVPSPDQCNPTGFYIENNTVVLCPEACAAAQTDKEIKITVEFTCKPLEPL